MRGGPGLDLGIHGYFEESAEGAKEVIQTEGSVDVVYSIQYHSFLSRLAGWPFGLLNEVSSFMAGSDHGRHRRTYRLFCRWHWRLGIRPWRVCSCSQVLSGGSPPPGLPDLERDHHHPDIS